MGSSASDLHVLVVDDNPDHLFLIQELLHESGDGVVLHEAASGEDALAFLEGRGGHAGAPPVDLVLLDLNMPRMSGWDVLAAIKASDRLRRLPVIILTSSRAEADIHRAYEGYAASYLVKPADLNRMAAMFQELKTYWAETAVLPARPN